MQTYIRTSILFLNKQRIVLGIASLSLAAALFFNGLLPGQIDNLASRYMSYGAMSCGAYDTENLLRFRCGLVGGEAGGIYTIGYPSVLLSAFLIKVLPFLGHAGTHFVMGLIIFSLAMFAFYKIARRLGIGKYLSVIAAGIYLISPIIISLAGFGGTRWGLVLLPLYIYVPLFCIDKLATRAWRRPIKVLLLAGLWAFINVAAIFMDGYSYFMAQAIMAAIGLMYIIFHPKLISTWVAAGMYIFANVIAYLMFTRLTPVVGTLSDESVDIFRAMGADLISFVVPSTHLLWNGGYRLHFSTLWGDGTNSMGNYIGILLALSVVIGLVLFVKQKKKKDSWLLLGITLSMLAAFVLSLGPSIKINDTKNFSENSVSRKSYIMPKSEAAINLPTEKLYTKVPGLKSMRATYRWHVVTMFAMILIAFYGLELISRKGHGKISIAIALAILIELVPNPSATYAQTTTAESQLVQFNKDTISPLHKYLNNNDKVIFLPGSNNDYLSSYLAASLKIHTQNLGNDKANNYARQFRSEELTKLFQLQSDEYFNAPKLVHQLLVSGEATVIVATKFSLLQDAYYWPPVRKDAGLAADELAKEFKAAGFDVQSENYFYVIRENSPNI